MNQSLRTAAKGLYMAFARSDLGRSVVESSLVSLNEYTFQLSSNIVHCHCYDCSSIDCAGERVTETVEFLALAPLML